MKAVAYVRCSTELQSDSPEQQRREIEAFAQLRGYEIIDWYVDFGESGVTFDQRPAFQKLRTRVESHPEFSTVIAFDESRWGRAIRPNENIYWREHLRRFGVDLVLVKTSIDPNHEYAPMMNAFDAIQASQYSKKLSQLTKRGAMANGSFSNGGTAPYGYVRLAENRSKGTKRILAPGDRIVKGQEKVRWALGDATEISIVQKIFALRVAGKGYATIAGVLNQDGVSCPKRGRWRNRDQKWSGVTIKTILENPVYYGVRAYNRSSMSKIEAERLGRKQKNVKYPHWINDHKNWVLVPGAHEPIVSEADWIKANSLRRERKEKSINGYTYRSPYLLSGLIRCQRCGFTYQGWSGKAKGHHYYRYVDSGWVNKHVCSPHAVDRDALDAYAVNCVKEVLSSPTFLAELEVQLHQIFDKQKSDGTESEDRRRKELQSCTAGLDHLTDTLASGIRSEAILEKLKKLEARKYELEQDLVECRRRTSQVVDVGDMAARISRFSASFDSVLAQADVEEKKALIKIWVNQVTIDRDRGVARVEVHKVPPLVPELAESAQNKKGTHEVVSARSSGDRT